MQQAVRKFVGYSEARWAPVAQIVATILTGGCAALACYVWPGARMWAWHECPLSQADYVLVEVQRCCTWLTTCFGQCGRVFAFVLTHVCSPGLLTYLWLADSFWDAPLATGIHSNLAVAITAGMIMKEAAVVVKGSAEPVYASQTFRTGRHCPWHLRSLVR